MSKFGLYTKVNNESHQHINLVEIPTIKEAEAYFAGVKQLSLPAFRDLFIVKEITTSNKALMYGNR
tara:strand:+ start:270 stop:467 length:198 start_codon:yes stop_codon:yes gene_type:complete